MRWLIRILFTLVMIVVLAVGALFLLPGERIARLAEAQIEVATGRAVRIGGDVRPSVYPQLGIKTGRVELANADWSDAGPMLVAEGLSIGVDLTALIKGELKITKLETLAPKILLETAKDGRANWEFSAIKPAADTECGATAPAAKATAVKPFTLDRGVIANGELTIVDRATGTRTILSKVNAGIRLPEFAGEAQLDLTALMNGTPVTANAKLGSFGNLIAGGVSQVDVKLTAGNARINFNGRGGIAPLAAQGALDADLSDLAGLFAALNQPAPDLPAGMGKKLSAKGNITYDDSGTLTLREGTLHIDQNVLTGNADLFLAAKPRLNAQFTTDKLDLSGLSAGSGSGAGSTASGAASSGGGGWSKAPIDVTALGALDAQVSVIAEAIDLGTTKLGKSRLLITLENSRAVFDIREIRAYDGVVVGQFVVNGRGGLSVGGDLKLLGIAMNPLLRDFAEFDRLLGATDLQIKFLASGKSMHDLMNSLSGEGAFKVGQGELKGLDLVGMLRNLDASYQGKGAKTIFDSIGASFNIKNGVLSNDNLAFVAPLAKALGNGTVDIGKQTLNYRVTPTALTKDDGTGGIKVPVLITGPWHNLKFRPDLKGLTEERLDLEKAKIEERAKAQVQKKVEKELGRTLEEGESVEDAVKKKLEEEAAKGLLKLLGRN